jgi:hypothetical protein
MNRTSSGAESGSPAIYDSRRAVCFDVVFIEGSGSWVPVSVVGVGRAIVAFVFIDDSVVVGFRFEFVEFRFCFRSVSVGGIL